MIIWDGIMMEKSPLISIRQTLTNSKDFELVSHTEVNLCSGAGGENFVSMYDNAPRSTTSVVKYFLEMESVTVLEGPTCSPDLNVMEQLWNIIERKIRVRQNNPDNAEQLIQAVLEEW